MYPPKSGMINFQTYGKNSYVRQGRVTVPARRGVRMLYLVIFFVLAILAASLFLIKIKVAFEYVRNKEDDDIVLSFYTMKGIFKYKYEIPLVDMGQKNIKFKIVREMGKGDGVVGERKERLKPTEIIDKITSIRKYYIDNKVLICDIKDYLHDRLLLVEFNLNIMEGTGNACYTGILCGFMWSFAGILTSYLTKSFKVMRKCVSISPCFNSRVFTVNFLCIFHVRLVHIIVVLMKIYSKKHKIKTKLEKEIGGGLSGRTASN